MKAKVFYGLKTEVGSILNLSPVLRKRLVRFGTILNPAWEVLQKFGSGYTNQSVPRYFNSVWSFEKELLFYRGMLSLFPKKIQKLFKRVSWTDFRNFSSAKFPELRLKLNEEQKQCLSVLETVLELKQRPLGNFLFVASTSIGKTLLAIAAAERLGQRTLVLCPTDLVLTAWKNDLNKAYGLDLKQIGLLKQSSWRLGKVFTLASAQTLARRGVLWDELNTEIGTVIVDEVQNVGAPSYFNFLAQCPAAYMIGLTATQDDRSGRPDIYVQALFGHPIIQLQTYHQETQNSLKITEVKLINTMFEYTTESEILDWHDLALAITSDEERNELIVVNAKKEWEQGRVVLLVSKRVEHCELLHQLLIEAGVTNVNILTGETNADSFYTHRLLSAVQKRKVTCIVATAQAIQVGANLPMLDSVHVAMPLANQRNLEQLFGRIRRKVEGKGEATITYYLDARVGYLKHLFWRHCVPVFRKMKIPGYDRVFSC